MLLEKLGPGGTATISSSFSDWETVLARGPFVAAGGEHFFLAVFGHSVTEGNRYKNAPCPCCRGHEAKCHNLVIEASNYLESLVVYSFV